MESGQESVPGQLAQSSCAFLHQPLWGGWLLNPDHFSCSFGGSAMSQIWGVRLSRGVKNRVPLHIILLQLFISVQSLSRVQLFATPWTAVCQASLSITNSQSLLKLMSIESVMPSNNLFLCRPLLLLPSVFPGIRVFSNDSALRIRWPKYWSFSFSISASNEYSGLISLQSKGLSRVYSNTTVQKHQFFCAQLSL